MIYAVIPVLVLGMLSYMFWRTAAQMRRDRVFNERKATRGKRAFTRLHRARFLLNRAFRLTNEEPPWHSELRSRLDQVPAAADETVERRPATGAAAPTNRA
ncbi:hypothetical protein DF286_08170 [Sphingosinicella humi]|uniref:Uncharacterized protein n=1 Tax=Allosphingosinicella humi TaxID=2068657 RepID=A0A2U2J3C4_9SPHN|nr:hypothetical protein DF286_08170 [Sphingosinicella humi]